jgi:hypothetical protein
MESFGFENVDGKDRAGACHGVMRLQVLSRGGVAMHSESARAGATVNVRFWG